MDRMPNAAAVRPSRKEICNSSSLRKKTSNADPLGPDAHYRGGNRHRAHTRHALGIFICRFSFQPLSPPVLACPTLQWLWVSGWVGGMVRLMDLPLSSWGYGLAPFPLVILRPLLLFVMELSIGDTVFYTSWDSRDS